VAKQGEPEQEVKFFLWELLVKLIGFVRTALA